MQKPPACSGGVSAKYSLRSSIVKIGRVYRASISSAVKIANRLVGGGSLITLTPVLSQKVYFSRLGQNNQISYLFAS
jgi:hypothetical protein